MAEINVSFYSQSLIRPVSFEMYIPNDLRSQEENPHYNRKCKTVFVLNGYSGWGRGWDKLYQNAENNPARHSDHSAGVVNIQGERNPECGL